MRSRSKRDRRFRPRSLMRSSQAWNLLRQMGPGWVAFRAGYALKKQAGWLEKGCPLDDWSAYRLADLAPDASPDGMVDYLRGQSHVPFSVARDRRARRGTELIRLLPDSAVTDILREVDEALGGSFRLFSGDEVHVGWPPSWHRHPITLEELPRVHWGRLSDASSPDVKWLWELGRFGLAFTIVRAYGLTGDTRYPEAFWQLVESWRHENPPNTGVHWMCGQECAFRVIAWSFALFGLLDADATTATRVATLVEMLAAHGERIEGNLPYALSQKNNHAVNEALALWTLGALFPMLAASSRWEAKGRRLLEQEGRRQIYADGAYVQQSLNYHRLILQSYAWAIELAAGQGRPFSSDLRARYRQATWLLYQLTDELSGGAPNYGSNDGSTLFRLDSCDLSDFRPTLGLAFWVAERRRMFPAGAWDEPLLWLCGEEPLGAAPTPRERRDLAASDSGYYTLRAGETWGFTRCGTYLDRPAHADLLHLDLWWRGVNVLADPGTYSYTGAPPWNNALAGTGVHNTVAIDGLDQMERCSRFMWLHWAAGRIIRRSVDANGRLRLLEGEHNGYLRRVGVVHRRAILVIAGRVWVVVDDLLGEGVHQLSSQWVFPQATLESQAPSQFRLRCPVGSFTTSFFSFGEQGGAGTPELAVVRGSLDTVYGWFSPGYLHKEPALSIVASSLCELPARRLTVIAFADDAVIESAKADSLRVSLGNDRFSAEWRAFPYAGAASLVRLARFQSEHGSSALPLSA